MNQPKVSLVVATFNDCVHLKKVIHYIQKQDYPNIEVIIVDGKSSDGTIEFLKSLNNSNFKWISEKDKGIYDAINKGIQLASGDIIGCCYDYLASNDTISLIVNTFIDKNVDAIHGDLDYVDDNGHIVRKWRMGNGNMRKGWMAAHPTLYVKKEIYKKYGLYNINYRISADYEFMVRIFLVNQVSLAYIPQVLINMKYGGTSTSSISSYLEGIKESYLAFKENNVKYPWVAVTYRFFKVLKQFI